MSNNPSTKLPKLERTHKFTKQCDDFFIGSTRVLNKNYLPQWSGENDDEYEVRLVSTAFSNMYAPIIENLAGLITKKPPTADGLEAFNLDNVDLKHHTLASYIKEVTKKSLNHGIVFVAVQSDIVKNRTYLKTYTYQDLLSYRFKDNKLTQIVFRDTIEVEKDKFGLETRERQIIFYAGGGEIWYKGDGEDESSKKDEWTNSLTEIPIIWVQTGKELSQFEIIPKFYDISMLNKVHLNLEGGIANILNVVSNPIPVFYGDVEEDSITISVRDAIRFTDKQSEGFEYVEIEGKGVGKLEDKIKAVEAQIDKTTFSILKKEDSKTVIDAQEQRTKNASFLTDVATELETKINILYQFVAQIENKTLKEDAKIQFQKDFDGTHLNIEIAKDLLLSGEMSRETFYTVLQTGELPKNFDIDKENNELEKDAGIE